MAKRKRTKEHVDPRGDQPTSANPFASLANLRDGLPAGEVTEDAASVDLPSSGTFASKVVLSRQRKGHGGKTVTVLSGVLLSNEPRAEFMRELGKALGTNVRDHGDDIILAGDQRERAKPWLEARGAKRVVTSG
jgi:translation initiation factor 1